MTGEEAVAILDILFDERQCQYCDHAYNCTSFGNVCNNWVHITKAGEIMRDWNKNHIFPLTMKKELKYIRMSEKELQERS